MEPLKGLLRSRKFWLAVIGVIQTLIFNYTEVPPEVWQSINVLLVSVVIGIAVEDAGEKSRNKPE